jgi:hypothetical protein
LPRGNWPGIGGSRLVDIPLWGYHQDMELGYTYFEAEDGFFVGWFDDFPEDVTQGKTLEELEEMLADMYDCLNLVKYHKRKLVLT